MDDTLRLSTRYRFLSVLTVVGAGFIALFLGWPFARLIGRGFGSTVGIRGLFTSRVGRIVWFTLWQAALSTIGVLLLAVPIAAALRHSTSRAVHIFTTVASVPFTLPTVVVGSAFVATMPGALKQGWVPIICAHIFFNLGFAVRTLINAIEQFDSGPWEAARTLGASAWTAGRTITMKQLQPTLLGITALVGSLCLTSFGVVLLLGGPQYATVDVEIYRQAIELARVDRAALLAAAQFLVISVALWQTTRLPVSPATSRTHNGRPPASNPIQALASVALLLIVLVPLGSLARRALTEIDGSFGFANFTNLGRVTRGSGIAGAPIIALWPSIRIALGAASIAITVAAFLSIVAVIGQSPLIRRGADLLTSAPLAVSAVALGLGVLIGFSSVPFAWRHSWWLLPCVQAVIAIPFASRVLIPALKRLPASHREAAQTLGASPWRAWFTAHVLRIKRSVALAFALCFTVSLGEFGATSFLARAQSPTLPVAIGRLASRPGALLQGQSSALAIILGALSIVAVGLIEFTQRTKP